MSLINKMLKDLEARQSDLRRPDPQSIYQGLRTSGTAPARGRRRLAAGVAAIVVVLGGIIGWAGWQRYSRPPEAVTAAPPTNVAIPAGPLIPSKPVAQPVAPKPRRPSVTAKVLPHPAEKANAEQAKKDQPADIEITGHPLTNSEQAENAYRDAVLLVRQNRANDAEQRLRTALSLNPQHVFARETLAGLLVEQGRWLEAQTLLEEGIKLLPSQASMAFMLARLYAEQGKNAAALQLLERVEPEAGGNPDYTAFMAALYQRTGQNADAVKAFRQAITARPTEGRWWAGLGISLEAENDRAGALEAYRRATALSVDPRLAEYVAGRLKQLEDR